MHAGTPIPTLGPRFRGTVEVGSLALVVLLMGLSTCETEVIVGDQFEDLRGTQFAGAAGSGEGEMVVFKSHDCTHGAGPRRTILVQVRRMRRLRFRFGGFLSHYIDPYIRGSEVEVIEKRIDNSSPIHPQTGLGMRTWPEVGHCPDTVCGIWRTDR